MARNNTSLTTWNIQHVNTPSRFAQYWLQIWLPKLPPETREAIFRGLLVEQVYDVYWYGEPIPFIEELRRSHDGMYEEAWDLLLRRQTLRLWLGNINMALKEDFRSIAAGVQRLELRWVVPESWGINANEEVYHRCPSSMFDRFSVVVQALRMLTSLSPPPSRSWSTYTSFRRLLQSLSILSTF